MSDMEEDIAYLERLEREESLLKEELGLDVSESSKKEYSAKKILKNLLDATNPVTDFKEMIDDPVHAPIRKAGRVARSFLRAPGEVVDLVTMPTNLIGLTNAKSASKWIADVVDYYTNDTLKPRNDAEEMADVLRSVISPGVLAKIPSIAKGISSVGKGLTKAIEKAPKGTKFIPKTAKGIGKFIKDINEPTIRNMAPALAGTGVAHQLLKEDPDSPLGAFLGGIGASALTGSVLPKSVQSIKPLSRYEKMIIRQKPEVAEKLLDKIGSKIGAEDILASTDEQAGKYAIEGARSYKEKADSLFHKHNRTLREYVNDHTDMMTNDKRFVDIKEPYEWIKRQYDALETDAMKQRFLQSPLGKEMSFLEHASGYSHMKRNLKVPYTDANNLRIAIDDSIKTFGQLGAGSKKSLEALRGKLQGQIGEKFKEIGPKAYQKWKRYNQSYEKYAKTRHGLLEDIFDKEHLPTDTFEKIRMYSKGAEGPEFSLMSIKDPSKREYFRKSLLRNLGESEGTFDPVKFHSSWESMQDPIKQRYLSRMPSEEKATFLKEIENLGKYRSIFKDKEGLPHIASELPDKAKTWLKAFTALSGRKLGSTSGIEDIYKRLGETSSGTGYPALTEFLETQVPRILKQASSRSYAPMNRISTEDTSSEEDIAYLERLEREEALLKEELGIS